MEPGTAEWLAAVDEPVIDPDREIVDPHHHLWPPGGSFAYGVDDLRGDTTDGHHVVATVFVECGAGYRASGPEHLLPVGETEFVAASAGELASSGAPPIAGIVARADLRRPDLDETLDAHAAAAGGRFRGIRHSLAHSIEPEAHMIPGRAEPGLAFDPDFRTGLRRLGERGLTYDSWLFHYQLEEFTDLARSAPETTMVLDHFGTPLGIGRWAGARDEVSHRWRTGIEAAASCPNVVAKIGGLAMPDNGFGWNEAELPPTSDDVVAAHQDYYHHTIEVFGPDRCMFESNFPVDKLSLSWRVYWNAAKKIASRYSEGEQAAMFAGNAARVYSLDW